MTVTADDRRRVVLPVKPGDRFDLQVSGDGVIRLVKLGPAEPPVVRARRVKGRWIGAEGVQFDPQAVIESIRSDREGR